VVALIRLLAPALAVLLAAYVVAPAAASAPDSPRLLVQFAASVSAAELEHLVARIRDAVARQG
jgi:hypothetical protein